VVRVLAFWWVATGVMFVLQRNVWLRLLALGLSLVALRVAARLLVTSRDDLTPAGHVRAFMAGALTWAAVVGAFFEGWVVGPAADTLGSATRGWSGALAAIQATITWEVFALAALGGVAYGVRRRQNQVALWTFFTFWVAHQTAKLNLFFGVENPGTEIFPSYLAHLGRYIGPEANSPLLPITILMYVGLMAVFLVRSRRLELGPRTGLVVLATLAGLAAVEHAMLATRAPVELWAWFLRIGRA
jgi:putative photosynthetic complex assembly protein 2